MAGRGADLRVMRVGELAMSLTLERMVSEPFPGSRVELVLIVWVWMS